MDGHQDKEFRDLLLRGIRHGFKIGFHKLKRSLKVYTNYLASARERPEVVCAWADVSPNSSVLSRYVLFSHLMPRIIWHPLSPRMPPFPAARCGLPPHLMSHSVVMTALRKCHHWYCGSGEMKDLWSATISQYCYIWYHYQRDLCGHLSALSPRQKPPHTTLYQFISDITYTLSGRRWDSVVDGAKRSDMDEKLCVWHQNKPRIR